MLIKDLKKFIHLPWSIYSYKSQNSAGNDFPCDENKLLFEKAVYKLYWCFWFFKKTFECQNFNNKRTSLVLEKTHEDIHIAKKTNKWVIKSISPEFSVKAQMTRFKWPYLDAGGCMFILSFFNWSTQHQYQIMNCDKLTYYRM